jgi:Protein of unknown function (DUF2510)
MAMRGWYADPLGRHERRFFDGAGWTDRVKDGWPEGEDPLGKPEGKDPLGDVAPPPPFTPTVVGLVPQYTDAPDQRGARKHRGAGKQAIAAQHAAAPQYVAVRQHAFAPPRLPAGQLVVEAPPDDIVVEELVVDDSEDLFVEELVGDPQPAERRSAIAALALGTVGMFLAAGRGSYAIGLMCGLLGLVLGLRGRRRVTARGAPASGLTTAGIVLGCAVIALGLHTSSQRRHTGSAFQSATTQINAVDADPSANKIRVWSCYRDPATKAPAATGSLVNTSDRTQAFQVTIAFPYPDTPTVFGTGVTAKVAPGKSASWVARDLRESFRPRSCSAVSSAAASS